MATEAKGHPIGDLGLRQTIFGAAMGLSGLALLVPAPPAGVSLLALSGFYLWSANNIRRVMPAYTLTQRAIDQLFRGDHAAASATLAQVDQGRANPSIKRAVAAARASIAADEGEWAKAEAFATEALAGKPGLFTQTQELVQMSVARSWRALARAVSGDANGAANDVRELRAQGAVVHPSALARAALSEAVFLAAAQDRPRLRELLAREGRMLRDHLTVRERALVRSLSLLAHAKKTSVYREPARPGGDEDPLAAWARRVSPAAAADVAEPRPQLPLEAPTPAPSPEAVMAIKRARKRPRTIAPARVLGLWVLLVVMFVAIYQVLQPAGGARAAPTPDLAWSTPLDVVLPVFAVAFAAAITLNVLRSRRVSRQLLRGSVAAARGDVASAQRELLPLARGVRSSPDAFLELARMCSRQGRFADAIAYVDQGLAAAMRTVTSRAIGHDLAIPSLITERAACLASTDRWDEARAELAQLDLHPTYPLATVSRFRVRLVEALRRGDRAAALALSRSRPRAFVIAARDEMLCDVLEATEGEGVSEDEWARIDGELGEDPELAGAVEYFLPGARARLTPRKRVSEQAGAGAEAGADAEAGAEADADAGAALRKLSLR